MLACCRKPPATSHSYCYAYARLGEESLLLKCDGSHVVFTYMEGLFGLSPAGSVHGFCKWHAPFEGLSIVVSPYTTEIVDE